MKRRDWLTADPVITLYSREVIKREASNNTEMERWTMRERRMDRVEGESGDGHVSTQCAYSNVRLFHLGANPRDRSSNSHTPNCHRSGAKMDKWSWWTAMSRRRKRRGEGVSRETSDVS